MPMTLISRTTLTGTAASVTFSSIPQTYQTLKLVVSARTDRNTGTTSNLIVTFNTSTASYSGRYLQGNGSAASSASNGTAGIDALPLNQATDTASTFSSYSIDIPNYTGSTNKAVSSDVVTENNATQAFQHLNAALWSVTSAITTITLTSFSSPTFSLLSGSTFSLYGMS